MNRVVDGKDKWIINAETTQIAKKVLRERLRLKLKPEFIICNISGNNFDLIDFRQFLQDTKGCEDIPLFVYTDFLTVEVRWELQKTGGIDDLITASITPEAFAEKLKTARRIRELSKKASTNSASLRRSSKYYINYFFKRTLDIAVAGTALLLLSPVFLLVAILIRLESKGPIFYISHRAGNGYKIFDFYKFRTMVVNADKLVSQLSHLNQYDATGKDPVFFKVSNDPRVTRLGAFLRNTSLDELPQLLNVVLGHMSLVGNRPLPLYEAATLTTDDYAGRFLAPAGITGLWQIKKRGQKNMSVKERINLDISYAENNSVLYDMWILANTPNALIQKDNV
ncbi:colanic biosynthesis UDP-glucose lipid carrier transferase [Chitinophaga flava]|uniref:Colanic biosynthesis UDP-glucose lipid carrier transferase n=2 Tax=Chitinophaga flava TaxID=2259036 RepID=A0A365XP88_9BACT|nr:colanic biosynthesis UDP-glucose lipid carrier transferase [Chitinophaga flava]